MSEKTRKDAITGCEIADTAASASSSASPSLNAFSAIMNKRKASSPCSGPSKKPHSKNPVFGRDGLGPYIDHPEKFDASRVICYDENFVAIHDLYPKSSVHTLLLPRSQKHTLQHPFDAFEDAEFLASVREQATKLRDYVGKELQQRYGKFSKQDSPRQKVLNKEIELARGEEMPVGRDWTKDVKVGIHAHPSMNHLHIHVLSIDRYSECLKHRKHYNSFATAFFVDLADFPLAKDDVRRKAEYLNRDMECWRCEKNFGNKFVKLKEHLREEFEEWKKE
ncbi:HIT domain-containing protein [Drepanopeziza brunnea f. sp. 'multigermtubi' MB_m1]|uniref:Aprataxin-like protein n=1 Tax=Marssonina brunnea f. sp. multigermtubi (strain MB_m1) TaxID=1072389 RepID=K1X5B2_MARBU|nr:HIT domain-containing protein [Drepanopeziza brunnea f. sp. 'multigermtubi' MB_m1]EKD20341.1 HIT domain-containing protein [Drepanopeziza brunnea f. sp. 'multigermtubi' MB_m1]